MINVFITKNTPITLLVLTQLGASKHDIAFAKTIGLLGHSLSEFDITGDWYGFFSRLPVEAGGSTKFENKEDKFDPSQLDYHHHFTGKTDMLSCVNSYKMNGAGLVTNFTSSNNSHNVIDIANKYNEHGCITMAQIYFYGDIPRQLLPEIVTNNTSRLGLDCDGDFVISELLVLEDCVTGMLLGEPHFTFVHKLIEE